MDIMFLVAINTVKIALMGDANIWRENGSVIFKHYKLKFPLQQFGHWVPLNRLPLSEGNRFSPEQVSQRSSLFLVLPAPGTISSGRGCKEINEAIKVSFKRSFIFPLFLLFLWDNDSC